MRWCAYCNCSFGTMEQEVVVDGNVLHAQCEAPFRKRLADKIAMSQHRLLHLPSIHDPFADDAGGGYGNGKL